MKPWLVATVFVILDTLCSSWTIAYYADRIISLNGSAPLIGLFVAFRALCTTIASPILGRFSDKYGRRPVALFIALGTLLTALIELLASDLPTYFISRIIFGVSRGCITVANGIAFDTTSNEKDRTAAVGRNFSSLGIGFLLGSATGGFLASFGFFIPSLVNVCLACLEFAWVALFVQDSWESEGVAQAKKSNKSSNANDSILAAFNQIWQSPELRSMFIFHATLTILNTSPQHAYLEFMRVNLEMNPAVRGIFFVIIGLLSALSQGFFPKVVAKVGGPVFVITCLLISGMSGLLAPVGGALTFITFTLLSSSVGSGPSYTLSTLSNASPENISGTISGIHESITNLALVIGGLICPELTLLHTYAPFWLSGGALLVMLAFRPKLIYGQAKGKAKSE